MKGKEHRVSGLEWEKVFGFNTALVQSLLHCWQLSSDQLAHYLIKQDISKKLGNKRLLLVLYFPDSKISMKVKRNVIMGNLCSCVSPSFLDKDAGVTSSTHPD